MKKLILILTLFLGCILTAQTASPNLEKLKSLIKEDGYDSEIKKEFLYVLSKDSLNVEALFLYGKFSADKVTWIAWENSIKYLTKAIEIDPYKPEYYWYRSKSYANHYFDNHALDSAVFFATKDLNKMISLGVKSVKIYDRLAFLYEKLASDYGQKYEYFEPKVSDGFQDDSSQEKDKLALLNKALENYKLAEESYNNALEIDPKNENVKSSLKYLMYKIKNLKNL